MLEPGFSPSTDDGAVLDVGQHVVIAVHGDDSDLAVASGFAETASPLLLALSESPTQIIAEESQPIPPEPGRPQRFDYEYLRNGTANLSVCLDAHRPWRSVKVTERRS